LECNIDEAHLLWKVIEKEDPEQAASIKNFIGGNSPEYYKGMLDGMLKVANLAKNWKDVDVLENRDLVAMIAYASNQIKSTEEVMFG